MLDMNFFQDLLVLFALYYFGLPWPSFVRLRACCPERGLGRGISAGGSRYHRLAENQPPR